MPSKLSNNIPPTDFTKNCQGYYLFTANQIDLNILMRTCLYEGAFSTSYPKKENKNEKTIDFFKK